MSDRIKASLLSLWLGAALFFSAVVAPAVFGVLRQFAITNAGEIAGAIVSRSLTVINVSGFLISLILLAATLFFTRNRNLMFWVKAVLLAVIVGGTAIGKWVVAARMSALRPALAIPINQFVLKDDPRLVAFNQLHSYSVALLSAAMIAASLFIIVSVVRRRAE
jgi:hypothetical protein